MLTFLFWNLKRKPLQKIVTNLAIKHSVDVLMLAECEISSGNLLATLNQQSTVKYHLPDGEPHKLVVYTRFPRQFIETKKNYPRFTVRRLFLPAQPELTLVVAHFPSKRNWNDRSQDIECIDVANQIREIEEEVGHRRTILIGDLNMHPFQSGVVAANGLHAVMSRGIALRKSRTVQTKRYPFFYNPMWGLMGDSGDEPPGTYYFERAEHEMYFWNMFDQVLLRPDLLHLFRNEDLKILTTDGTSSFLTAKGLPDDSVASDHLPVIFKLNLL